jgi:hypothetical protein
MVHDRVSDRRDLQDVGVLDAGLSATSWASVLIASRTAAVISLSPPGFIMT